MPEIPTKISPVEILKGFAKRATEKVSQEAIYPGILGKAIKTFRTFGLGRLESNPYLEENYPNFIQYKRGAIRAPFDQGEYVLERTKDIIGSTAKEINKS